MWPVGRICSGITTRTVTLWHLAHINKRCIEYGSAVTSKVQSTLPMIAEDEKVERLTTQVTICVDNLSTHTCCALLQAFGLTDTVI